jgi:subfamily B ATP-binding cassette protein MsbA
MKRKWYRERRPTGERSLIAGLLRPYRGWLAIILLATGAETAASLAAPWPLKIVLDNVIEGRASAVQPIGYATPAEFGGTSRVH